MSTKITEALAALRRDLLPEDRTGSPAREGSSGPRISTMRNYRFAIVPYDPADEFTLRAEVNKLTSELMINGWVVLSISLQQLLLDRVRAQGEAWTRKVIEMERRMHGIDRDRGLNYLKAKVAPLIEGPDGIAADCARRIAAHAEAYPDRVDRTLALIGRAGALYPFYRSSALLRHLDGHTRNVPVVLLYPGMRQGPSALSFMGALDADSDYRPRIYP